MSRLAIILPLAAILSGMALESALAQSCGERAAQFGRQYASGPAPAPTGTTGEGTTLPAPPATTESRGMTDSQPPPRQAAVGPNVMSTLGAARDADRRGNTAECEQLLSSARRAAGGQ
ncbi:MAG TPA: hypothetical protein VLV50_09185 [Stellaceae bacterium]|nr:hypothetical protein [Stellaceae bacterium]